MNRSTRNQTLMGWLLLVPALAIFALMIFYPFINSIFISFTSRNLLYAKSAFIGFENYRKLFSDPNTLFLIWTTIKFVLLSTLMPFTIGLIWALLMNQKFK
ncbi:MAG: sugar ABC transporter permease, partial [Sphaerochaeta sp.]|nr:sugar ABC transporter permease [Sphaerochaeta sp.]MDD4039055.1 sugar ABC transporter permease [Sphaerochaeta sp.]